MLCTNCGKQMPEGAHICPECGAEYYFPTAPTPNYAPTYTPVPAPAAPEPVKKKKLTGLIIAIATIALLMFLGVNIFMGIAAFHLLNTLTFFPGSSIDGSTPPSSSQGFTQQEIDYAAAMALLENQQYDDALTAFRALGDYRDSMSKANDCAYAAASQCLDRGDLSGALDYISYMHKSQRPIIYERYNALAQARATAIVQESLKTNFYDLLHSTQQLPYDSELQSHHLALYNNTIYRYTLSYQILYYDNDGNLLRQSHALTAEIGGASYIRVPMPVDTSFEWARYDVEYKVQDVDYQLNQSPRYAVRLLDDQGAPIYNARVSLRLGDSILISNLHACTTDIYGLASLFIGKKVETFRVSVSYNPGYNYQEQTHEFSADGWVHDVVVLRDTPDFSVTVVDTDGDPIPGVTLFLTTTDVFTASDYRKTDENGYACWYDVDISHTYKLTDLRKIGFVAISEAHFKPDEHHITVVMEREKPKNDTPSFTVTVVDKNGNPIAGVMMYLTPSDVSTQEVYGKTDKDGNSYWYDANMSHTYKIVRITKKGYVSIKEIHFQPGENHLTIVLEEESET